MSKFHRRPFRLSTESLERRDLFVVPDFSLADVNPQSASHNDNISPRDFVGDVSGWYFIHTT